MGMLARIAAMGGSAAAQTYVDDVFSAYTYSGTSATQTITNGVDLAGNGGLVWIKARNSATYWNVLFDTARGGGQLSSNNTDASLPSGSNVAGYVSYNSGGFTTQPGSLGFGSVGLSGNNYVSWTFRKAAKFFDVVTYTGNGSNRTISHNLGQAPGMILVKRTDTTGSWMVYHRSLANTENLVLNTTAAKATNATAWNSTTADASVFSLGTHADVNTNGGTYVAYLFAHDTATDGLIQCGSYTGNGSAAGPTVTLGWEPQFVIVKVASGLTGQWSVVDSMRGLCNGTTVQDDQTLFANLTNAEGTYGWIKPTATGFTLGDMDYGANWNGNGDTYIYLAIRRPNKPPTSGTQIYNAIARTGTGAAATVTGVGFAPDSVLLHSRSGTTGGRWEDRLRGATQELVAETNALEAAVAESITAFGMDGFSLGTDGDWNTNTATYINWCFKRAPGVFDIVCYPGTGSATTVSHGLGVAPELMIVKSRSYIVKIWLVYHKDVGHTKYLALEQTGGPWTGSNIWNDTAPSTSVFTLGTYSSDSNVTYVAYLFATKAGISKVFSYTGNGTNQNIECGFSTGARFVLIKRTDSTGNWLIADTTRGLVSGNDPSLALNSNTAEVTTLDWIDPYSGGFNVVQESTNNANVNNATYIGLAFS